MSGTLHFFVLDSQWDKICNNINLFMLVSSKHEQMKITGVDYSNLDAICLEKDSNLISRTK